jgi:hypothetical protein
VFNATFNNILVVWWQSNEEEKQNTTRAVPKSNAKIIETKNYNF